jgi:hypothetical protein
MTLFEGLHMPSPGATGSLNSEPPGPPSCGPRRLLGVERQLVSVEGVGVGMEAEAVWDHLRTWETCLGSGRSHGFASPGCAALDERGAYELPRT